MSKVNFYSADKEYPLKHKNKIKKWITNEIDLYHKKIEEINIIFCSDEYLLEINKKFLNHFYFTDVITFDNSREEYISGEIYISVDRIKENAKKYKVPIFLEFQRVIIHGCFHLLQYTDNTEEAKAVMREKENEAINRYLNL